MRRILLVALGLAPWFGCSGSSSSAPPLTLTSAPRLDANPHGCVPLSAVVTVATSEPTVVELRVDDGTRSWSVPSAAGPATAHAVPVLGVRPGLLHTVQVTVRDEAGRSTTHPQPLEWVTPALLDSFPPIRVTVADAARMQPGGTVLNIVDTAQGDRLVMLDHRGDVVWYLDPSVVPHGSQPPNFLSTRLDNGNFLITVDRRGLVEVKVTGEVVAAYWASNTAPVPGSGFYVDVPVDSFHHDAVAMPVDDAAGAAYAVLGTELRTYPNYPRSEVDPSLTDPSAEVVGDVIVELARDGTVLRQLRLLDLLDPYRMCYDTLFTYWNDHYGRTVRDWSHANALLYDAKDDAYLVSLRHQDAVVKIARGTGQLQWILGPHERWAPRWQGLLLAPFPGLGWNFHQHAPTLLADGGILMFDNGNHRAVPPTPGATFQNSYSRAVEFFVDESLRTVRQRWAYGAAPGGSEPSFYSFFVGDADPLANGNVLVCDGGKLQFPNQNLFGRVVEVTRDAVPSLVFEAFVEDQAPTAPKGYFVYRAFRVPALHD